MTYTLFEEAVGNFLILIRQDKLENGYYVEIAKSYSDDYAVPFDRRYYPTLQQAKRRYSYLMRKAREL